MGWFVMMYSQNGKTAMPIVIAAERDFYREQLERIASAKRKTRAVRLTASALAFLDATTAPNKSSSFGAETP